MIHRSGSGSVSAHQRISASAYPEARVALRGGKAFQLPATLSFPVRPTFLCRAELSRALEVVHLID
jgi:hypothetical protein